MKITMYELLGMVKEGKKLPKKVKVLDVIYEFDDHYGDYYNKLLDRFLFVYMTSEEDWKLAYFLNAQVEILEEEKKTNPLTKKDIEALGYACGEIQKCFTNGWTKSLENKPLEEEKKIPEKLDHLIGYDIQLFDDLKEYVEITTNDLFGKVNKIIDTLNQLSDYLKSKGE